MREAAGWMQVCERLRNASYSAVLCERSLTGGSWKDVLVELEDCNPSPPLIVTSRHADNHLWAEVLNLGGYDVLMTPFEESEVIHLLIQAAQLGIVRRAPRLTPAGSLAGDDDF